MFVILVLKMLKLEDHYEFQTSYRVRPPGRGWAFRSDTMNTFVLRGGLVISPHLAQLATYFSYSDRASPALQMLCNQLRWPGSSPSGGKQQPQRFMQSVACVGGELEDRLF